MGLLQKCGNILPQTLNSIFNSEEIQNLISAGLVHLHKSSGSLLLTEKGQRCYAAAMRSETEKAALSYRGSLIQRRIRTSDFVLTAYRAGPPRFVAALPELSSSGALYLPAASRGRDRNLWGSSRMAAIMRLGYLCCGVYSVYPNAGKANPEDERKTLENCVSQIKGVQTAFLFAGDSYSTILAELDRTGDGEMSPLSFGEMWRRTPLPVYLMACDETGALQLKLMAQPNYRQRLARAGLGEGYAPPPKELSHCDGMLKGIPFVIAADMDLIRLETAYAEACRAGFRQIAAAALKGQVQSVLRERYQGKVRLFTITEKTLTTAFGNTLPLYTPRHEAYLNQEGDVVNVPPIQGHRKAGG